MFIGDRKFELLNPDIKFDDAPGQDGTVWQVKYDNEKFYVRRITDTDAPEGVAVFYDVNDLAEEVEDFYEYPSDEVYYFIDKIKKLAGLIVLSDIEKTLEVKGYDFVDLEYVAGDTDGRFRIEHGGEWMRFIVLDSENIQIID